MSDHPLSGQLQSIHDAVLTGCLQPLRELDEHLRARTTHIDSLIDSYVHALEALAHEVSESNQQHQDLLEHTGHEIQNKATHLEGLLIHAEQAAQHALDEINAQEAQCSHECQSAQGTFQESASLIGQAFTQLHHCFDSLLQRVTSLLQGVDHTVGTWHADVVTLGTEHERAAVRTQDELAASQAAAATLAQDAARDWVSAAAHLTQGSRQLFTTQIAGSTREDGEQLVHVLETLQQSGVNVAQGFCGRASELLDSIRSLTDLLASIEPLLEAVDALI